MFAAAGGTLAIAGLRHLGASLTPYPKPGAEAELRVHGAYRLVRHPIYGGLLLVCVGWSLLTSPSALVTSIVLGLVVWGKSMREEAWLLDRYPGYEGYRRQVRRRFLPYVW
jgi:protein-S-isoprenylcysteine O-methyltransferase Ste14